jgi:hypothetical protein
MFSIKIIDSAKFLKMPSSTRLLYFDLCMRADDDGVVEGFNVLRMTGATEDDLKILVAKEFIKVLNEDLVAYVMDWKEHNKIRPDRKVDSIYKDLLLQILPDIKLLEPKQRADLKAKEKMDSEWTSNGQPNVSLGKGRIGQDSLVKESIVQSSTGQERETTQLPTFPTPIHELIFNQFKAITYDMWFRDSIIEEKGDLIIITVQQFLTKRTIVNGYAKAIETLTGKNITVKSIEKGED